MKTLYLLDIDGTLVNVNDIHLKAYQSDYLDVLKIGVPAYIITNTFGLPDSSMHRQIFREINLPYDDATAQKLMQIHPKNFSKLLSTHPVVPLDGVTEFLEAIKSSNGYIGVISGNMEIIAKMMLEKSGLSKYFSLASFDDGISTRAQIVQRAISKARAMKYDFEKVVVIGDTLHDIEAAKKSGAFAVGVATGSCTIQQLSKTADLVLESMKDYKRILE
jgi:HAD superfamily hydrolase (TIGR01549 family)